MTSVDLSSAFFADSTG